ncbi:MAG TPA: hypothetical protein VF464_11300, partial [Candidatus Methylomirabilis sp.]
CGGSLVGISVSDLLHISQNEGSRYDRRVWANEGKLGKRRRGEEPVDPMAGHQGENGKARFPLDTLSGLFGL